MERWKKFVDEEGKLRVDQIRGMRARGVDVANSEDGDEAAIARGKGSVLIEIESFPCPNANKLGEAVSLEMARENIADDYVGVDGIGVGAGAVNELKRLKHNVVSIISSEKPEDIYDKDELDEEGIKLVEKFENLRSQMWWQFKLDLEDPKSDIALPDDNTLFADLMTPLFQLRKGKIVVQPKEEIRKKLGRSPNKGDAVVYWNWIRRKRRLVGAVGNATEVDPDHPENDEREEEKRGAGYHPRYRDRRRRSF